MIEEGSRTHAFVIGDSQTSNSLGRVLSMAISAQAAFDEVEVLAYADGPLWAGSGQFEFDVMPFSRREIPALAERIRQSGAAADVLVWLSKGADPVGRLVDELKGAGGVTIVADFDDNDVAIMKNFRSQSIFNALKVNPLRRKYPARLARAQARLASKVHGLTFSNSALADAYRHRLGVGKKPWSVVPHTRTARTGALTRDPARTSALTLGFLGTVRAHKGAAELVRLMRKDRSVNIVSFLQEWSPPEDCDLQWRTHAPTTGLAKLYEEVDFLVLPMDSDDEASLHQLPAKLVDAAANGCPVAATPTPPIVEFAGNAIIQVEAWGDPAAVLASLRSADREALSQAITQSYERWFSPEATGQAVLTLTRRVKDPA